MFDFKPSATLVRNIVLYLRSLGVSIPNPNTEDLELLRTAWGKSFVSTVGTYAQRLRYEIALEKRLVVDGKFTAGFEEMVGGTIPIPEGVQGDLLIRELAQEFVEWAKVHGSKTTFHPRAPILKIEGLDAEVVLQVRPRDPPIHDPTFVRATLLE